jgi:class 3 adenylate cyclase/tetratricopeptide (TPR) repeat protein
MLEIESWLNKLGLSQYNEVFSRNAIDFTILPSLTDADLKDIGVAALGHRKKLLAAIAQLESDLPAVSSTKGFAEPSSVAERRNLTVMFVDLVGSTVLSGRLDPEEMREVLQTFQNTVAGEISRYEGHIAKFMGDGVLAYFGWPRAHEDEAERAIRAALAISGVVSKLVINREVLACRIGIATGVVVVGDLIGEGAAQEEAVVGETPNLASRLQGVAHPGAVVISDVTRELVGDLFEFRLIPRPMLKGFETTIPAFEVIRERPLESRFAARSGNRMRPLVGREQELALLVERWRQAEHGEGQMVMLMGEAGIGKSRLCEALVSSIAGSMHRNLRYQCSPYHTESALWPVIQQLSFAAGFESDDSNETRLDKLEALLARGSATAVQTALFASLLGLETQQRYGLLELTPEQRRNKLLEALVDQLMGLATQQPILFLFEDAHWIDPTTLDLIERILDRVGQARVLMLITARPVFSHGFGGHPLVTRLALNRLGRTHTATIIDKITGGKSLPDTLVEEIMARTDGVPLFVEEMTKAVLESGILQDTPQGWQLIKPLSQVVIPSTLHDSLMARLDRQKPVKELAQTAAVIGRAFDHETIAALSPQGEAELNSALGRLVEAELIFRRGTPPEATYLFKHALVRDTAYESMLKGRRTALHGKLFGILERKGDTSPEILAQHAESAGLFERALDYWEQAGAQAMARPAYKEAISHFRAAIRLCGDGDNREHQARELRIQVQLGQALIAYEGYQAPGTMESFERARELAELLAEPQLLASAIYGLWANRYVGGKPFDLTDRFNSVANSENDSGLRCVGLRFLALEQFHSARFQSSLDYVQKALAIYDPVAHRSLGFRFGHDPKSSAMTYKGWNLWHLGYPEQARTAVEEALNWARTIKHTNTVGIALCFGNLLHIWLRDINRAEAIATEALKYATEMSLGLWHAWSRIHLGWAIAHRGSDDAVREMEVGIEQCRSIGAARFEAFHLTLLADLRSKLGQHNLAKATFADAFETLERVGDIPVVPEFFRLRAASKLRESTALRGEAINDLSHAHQLAFQQGAKSYVLRTACDLAQIWAESNDRRKSLDFLAPIYDEFTEGHNTEDLKEARLLIEGLR